MITAQGGITKWQRVKISSDGGMDAGKPAIAKGANYPEKSSMDTAMEKHMRNGSKTTKAAIPPEELRRSDP